MVSAKLKAAAYGKKHDYNMQIEADKLIRNKVKISQDQLSKLIQKRLHFPEVI